MNQATLSRDLHELGLVKTVNGYALQAAEEGPLMPPLDQLAPARLTLASRVWMIVLRGYLVVAGGLVLVRIVELALGGVS